MLRQAHNGVQSGKQFHESQIEMIQQNQVDNSVSDDTTELDVFILPLDIKLQLTI